MTELADWFEAEEHDAGGLFAPGDAGEDAEDLRWPVPIKPLDVEPCELVLVIDVEEPERAEHPDAIDDPVVERELR